MTRIRHQFRRNLFTSCENDHPLFHAQRRAENLELIQLDVKIAFLHCDLEEEIYMEELKGFVASGQEHIICRLKKSLYGLKHTSRQWYKKFDDFIQPVGFSKSDEDHCLFIKTARDGSPIFLIIYVDDMLLFGRHSESSSNLFGNYG